MKTTRIALAAIAALWAHGCDDSGQQPGPGSTDAASMADVVRPDDRATPMDAVAPIDTPATATDNPLPPADNPLPPADNPVVAQDVPVVATDTPAVATDTPAAPVDSGTTPDAGPEPEVGAMCSGDGDCGFDPVGSICDPTLRRCVECADSADCPGVRVCTPRRTCARECAADDECFSFEYCAPWGACEQGCRDDSTCFGSTPRCSPTTRECVRCVNDAQCGAGSICRDGSCMAGCSATVPCAAGRTCCGGMCFDLQTNPTSCGTCGNRCAAAMGSTATCAAGRCGSACATGLADCDGNAANGCETNLQTSTAHCGMCRNACPASGGGTATCASGRCGTTCAGGRGDCDGNAANGCETTLDTTMNCGACGRACAPANGTGACVSGACTLAMCTAGFANCDNNLTNGCEVDTRTSLAHCGACGRACSFPNRAATCANGTCAAGACNPGFADCDGNPANGCEVDTRTSLAHCGACGRACAAANGTAVCAAGACGVGSCNAGFSNCDMNAANGCEHDNRATCGGCDLTCRERTVGGSGNPPFDPAGQRGTAVDPMGGLVVSGMSMQTVADYLWVVNTAESTISKWDATGQREIARYRVGLANGECRGQCCWDNGCNMPSRVVVDGGGDAYVASRGFQFQGSVTKIAADRASCVDRNNNGTIETSSGATNVLGYGEDECVLWTANVGARDAVLRALTVDRGDASFPNGYVWVGAYNSRQAFRLNPRTGAVLNTLSLGMSPYGFVVTRDGRLWASTLDSSTLQSINTATLQVEPTIAYPIAMRSNCRNSYGITADARGRIWIAGWDCHDALGYDPATQRWTRVDTTGFVTGNAGRGITVDANGRIWMAYSTMADGPSGGLLSWDGNAFVAGGTIPGTAVTRTALPGSNSGPSALGIDRVGNIWLAHFNAPSNLIRYTPMTGQSVTLSGPNRVYSYSDFTGSVRRTAVAQGSYEETIDLGCDAPTLTSLSWSATTPTGTSVTFSARSAATVVGLGGATPVTVALAPRDTSPVDIAAAFRTAMVTPARQIRLSIAMQSSEGGASPTLRSFNLRWRCPTP